MPQFTNASHDVALQLGRTSRASRRAGRRRRQHGSRRRRRRRDDRARAHTRGKVAALFEKFSVRLRPQVRGHTAYACDGGSGREPQPESFDGEFIKADAKKGLNLENPTNFFVWGNGRRPTRRTKDLPKYSLAGEAVWCDPVLK